MRRSPPHPQPPIPAELRARSGPSGAGSGAPDWPAAARSLLQVVPESFLRRLPGRETFFWTVGSPESVGAAQVQQPVVVKRFAARRGCPAREEFRTLEALRREGLPVPEPLAWVAQGRRSLLLLERRPSSGHLGEVLARADEPRRRALAGDLLEILVRFHGALWCHRDLYLSHILVGPDDRLTLIDAGRIMRRGSRTRARRWLAKDLAALHHSTPAAVTRSERLRFLIRWLHRTDRLGPDSPPAAARRILRSWARDVERRRRSMAAHRPRHGEPGPYARIRPTSGPERLPATIVRLPSWVGDAVMAEPLLRALAQAHRRAGAEGRLVFLGPAPVLALFAGRFRGVRRRTLVGREVPSAYAGHDVALFLNGSLASVIAARRARVPLRCGWDDGGRSPWLTHPVERHLGSSLSRNLVRPWGRRPDPHPFTAAARALGESLGLRIEDPRPRLVPTERARSAQEERLRSAGLADRGPFLLLNAGGRPGSAKAWPVGHWADLICALGRDPALPIVLTAGPGEEQAVRRVSALVRDAGEPPPTLLIDPVPDLEELVALAAAAALVIGTDSGPAHVAAAAGTPSVVVMGPTDPRHTAEYGERRRILRVPLDCGPCQRERCPLAAPDRDRCMIEVRPVAVASAASDLLALEADTPGSQVGRKPAIIGPAASPLGKPPSTTVGCQP